jgi:hypothetical protein
MCWKHYKKKTKDKRQKTKDKSKKIKVRRKSAIRNPLTAKITKVKELRTQRK